MSKIIPKKPALVYNSIEHQSKTAANSLTIGEWNRVVNILKQQANFNTKYLEDLHRMLFYDWNSDDSGYAVGELLSIFSGHPDSDNIFTVLEGKVDKLPGKGLSTNDYTDEDKQNIADLENDKVDKVPGKGLSDENFTLLEKNKLSTLTFVTQVVPDEDTIVFNADDELEASNVSIWRFE